jgi:FAD/FMN-containing dehydrogenase
MTESGLKLVAEHRQRRPPITAPAVLLVEAGRRPDTPAALEHALGCIDGIGDTAVATSAASRSELFSWREGHTEAVNARHPVLKFDISVPTSVLGDAVRELPRIVEEIGRGAEAVLYGHLGDASLHLSVLPPAASIAEIEEQVLAFVDDVGGSPSAEHGIGRLRTDQLAKRRTPNEIRLFRSLKHSFDPQGLFNPGAMVPTQSRSLT